MTNIFVNRDYRNPSNLFFFTPRNCCLYSYGEEVTGMSKFTKLGILIAKNGKLLEEHSMN